MTQRERVLKMLRAAGSEGVRSDAFLAVYMPRAAARIKELRDSGYEISSGHEKQFVRYTLTGVPSRGGVCESPPFHTHERAGEKAPPSQASPALQLFEPSRAEAA
jgi:hypothetical protein